MNREPAGTPNGGQFVPDLTGKTPPQTAYKPPTAPKTPDTPTSPPDPVNQAYKAYQATKPAPKTLTELKDTLHLPMMRGAAQPWNGYTFEADRHGPDRLVYTTSIGNVSQQVKVIIYTDGTYTATCQFGWGGRSIYPVGSGTITTPEEGIHALDQAFTRARDIKTRGAKKIREEREAGEQAARAARAERRATDQTIWGADNTRQAALTYNAAHPEAAAQIATGRPELLVIVKDTTSNDRVTGTLTPGIRTPDGGFIAAADPETFNMKRADWMTGPKVARWLGNKRTNGIPTVYETR